MIDIAITKNNENEFLKVAERLGTKDIVFLGKKGDIIIVKESEKARHYLEKTDIDMIYGLEEHKGKDPMHFRASGLNHILAEIAHKRKKIIAFNFNAILNTKGMLRSQLLGRMRQNVMLCRKYKVEMALASFAANPYELKSEKDLQAFGETIGMAPGEANKAVKAVEERIRLNKRKSKGEAVIEGIERI